MIEITLNDSWEKVQQFAANTLETHGPSAAGHVPASERYLAYWPAATQVHVAKRLDDSLRAVTEALEHLGKTNIAISNAESEIARKRANRLEDKLDDATVALTGAAQTLTAAIDRAAADGNRLSRRLFALNIILAIATVLAAVAASAQAWDAWITP